MSRISVLAAKFSNPQAGSNQIYYKSNPALLLATRVFPAARYLVRSGLPAVSREKHFPESHIIIIDQACAVKMAG